MSTAAFAHLAEEDPQEQPASQHTHHAVDPIDAIEVAPECAPSPSLDDDDVTMSARCRRWGRHLLHRLNPRNWQPLAGWPLLMTYFALTFAQNLPTTAVGLLLARSLHFEPDQTSEYYAATFIPWTIRPVYAFISDQLPLFSYRRRPYFIICAVAACVMQVCLALFGKTKSSFAFLGVATQVFLAFSEVACDSLSVEWGNELATRVQLQRTDMVAPTTAAPAEAAASPDSSSAASAANDRDWSQPLLDSSRPTVLHPTIVHVHAASEESVLSSPASSSYSSLAPDAATPSPESPAESLAKRTVAHIFASTADPAALSPVLIKSRIQSECMSVRTSGSVCAAATSIVMLLFMEPRTVIFWASLVFLAGIGSIVFYVQEKKVARGYFGLTHVDNEAPLAPAAVESSPQAPTRGGHDDEKEPESIELRPLGSDNPCEDSSSEGNSSGLPVSRWVFLFRKFLTLLGAIRVLIRPLLFVFLINLMPTSGDAYYNYLYSYYSQFMSWQYGLFSFISLTGSLLGCLFYQHVLATSLRSLKFIFVITTVASSIAGCSEIFLATRSNRYIGLGDQAFIIIDSFIVAAVGILAQMPTIVLASHYAPKGLGLEASMFSLFAASAHVGALGSASISAEMTRQLGITQDDWSNLWKLILICNVLAMQPLLLMPLLLPTQPVEQLPMATAKPTPAPAMAETEEESETSPTEAVSSLLHPAHAHHV